MQQASRRPFLLGNIALAACTALAPRAQAQSAATPGADSGGVQQIQVTAQRRVEKLQDVPLAATAVLERDLEQRGIFTVVDLASIAPNLQISQTPGNSTSAQISIRGSVTTNPALFWDPTVGMYVDGVYVGKTQGSVFELVDLERVEVLRGPQGTLYGRNTLAARSTSSRASPAANGRARPRWIWATTTAAWARSRSTCRAWASCAPPSACAPRSATAGSRRRPAAR